MNGYLLDINVLIALFWPTHANHDKALNWFVHHQVHGWATCPLTETGFVRIVSNPAFSRDAVTPREAANLLASNKVAKKHTFWPDEISLDETIAFAGQRLVGHQQVTDAYLLALAIHRGGKLVTMDQRITSLVEPGSAKREAIAVLS